MKYESLQVGTCKYGDRDCWARTTTWLQYDLESLGACTSSYDVLYCFFRVKGCIVFALCASVGTCTYNFHNMHSQAITRASSIARFLTLITRMSFRPIC